VINEKTTQWIKEKGQPTQWITEKGQTIHWIKKNDRQYKTVKCFENNSRQRKQNAEERSTGDEFIF
jgi:hypothetical protein